MLKTEELKTNISLAPYTYIKIGGPAKYFYVANSSDDISEAVSFALSNNLNYLILGLGGNVLFPDEGFDGLVILNRASSWQINEEEKNAVAQSGVILKPFITDLAIKGFAGLEFFANIPGSVGGAVAGNAGAYGHSISEEISWVKFIDPEGEIITENRDFFEFEYRSSRIKKGYRAVILEVCFDIYHKNSEELLKQIEEDEALRKGKHPEYPSCGSFFKNISREITAGKLIEDAGLKGFKVGDAMVSDKHANFIVNTGNATAKDVKTLADHIVNVVKEKTGYDLEREVVIIKNKQ
ncbi:MAG: UDP-N-acetylenolpyruvoylglucosamine reductase [candidate division CPR2 bacterium GW2011_GWC1_39_9]|uniref:UDP-N-acetylenolpyruvoylglucosamine reductase n=1 Tax=candidate division CPR2 bacterium GW2011_GWC2_39_10 TaxID=1618345 RepID=A0A0G0PUQ2_UNCC2|nr:MAG: UDP-N-acetylenolpyruvoylglucosamine reductase [candidate division CPR2 bacterium GW2011_GWC2_39_10]KKR33992.1 MAG: UDP-N-acetylenolpyruvoylglucosamine reductase [candidate division CPR2 bacterium GW2011_GWC1_39_9]